MLTHRGIEDFGFHTQENQLESINQQIRNARMSGGIIAAISLIVGGIGIMNIMLASINERIREIGICKAVGATGLAVFTQVLIESIVIALLGAALGVVASYGFVRLLEHISPTANAPVITPMAMAGGRRLQRRRRHLRRPVPRLQSRPPGPHPGAALRIAATTAHRGPY